MTQNCDITENGMAYKDEQNIVFVRVPMSEAEERKIDQAVAQSGLKKYEWVRRALLSKAENAGSEEPNE